MSDWKTTTFGLLAACGVGVLAVGGLPHWLELSAKVGMAIGLGGTGYFARDRKPPPNDNQPPSGNQPH